MLLPVVVTSAIDHKSAKVLRANREKLVLFGALESTVLALASSGSICILFAERIAPLRLNILSQLPSVARAPNTRLAMRYSVGCENSWSAQNLELSMVMVMVGSPVATSRSMELSKPCCVRYFRHELRP